jgi:DNA-binding transcriptional ArsR family regulator
MTQTTHHSQPPSELSDSSETTPESKAQTDPEALLSLLSDDHARAILKTLSTDPLPAREIAERLDLSRPTVYRRLNQLQESGAVTASLSYDPDGHHRQQFQTNLDQVVLSIDGDDISIDQIGQT